MLIAVRQHLGHIQELLIAHVAFAAAEEDVGRLLPLHALVTAEDTVILSTTQRSGILPWRLQTYLSEENLRILS